MGKGLNRFGMWKDTTIFFIGIGKSWAFMNGFVTLLCICFDFLIEVFASLKPYQSNRRWIRWKKVFCWKTKKSFSFYTYIYIYILVKESFLSLRSYWENGFSVRFFILINKILNLRYKEREVNSFISLKSLKFWRIG